MRALYIPTTNYELPSTGSPQATRYSLLATSGAGVYIHLPFCLRKCAYCDFASYPLASLPVGLSPESYTGLLIREIGLLAKEQGGLAAGTLYFGGGTPSLLPVECLERIFAALRSHFDLGGLQEFTIEANPDTLGRELFQQWRELGVTRVSIGIQSLCDESLRQLGRTYSSGGALTALYELADELAAFDLSFDLLLGLPWQPPEQIAQDIAQLLLFQPCHFSLYGLKLEEGTPLWERAQANPSVAPDDDRIAGELELAEQVLAGSGFLRYEVSNFARPEKWSRHNLNYWRGGDYFGFGLNASGCVNGVRTRNHRGFAEYFAALERGELPVAEREELSSATIVFERAMLGLRTMWGISPEGFSPEVWQGLHEKALTLEKVESGLVVVEDGRIALTSRGMNVGNAVTLEIIDGVM
jgi:oxygen-independent coproporphyrinogen-3 oxidase